MRHKGRVAVLVGDMGDTSFGQKIVDHALQRWGRIDGLIVNHGTLDPIDRIRDVHIQQWKRAFDVNVFGVVGLVRHGTAHAVNPCCLLISPLAPSCTSPATRGEGRDPSYFQRSCRQRHSRLGRVQCF